MIRLFFFFFIFFGVHSSCFSQGMEICITLADGYTNCISDASDSLTPGTAAKDISIVDSGKKVRLPVSANNPVSPPSAPLTASPVPIQYRGRFLAYFNGSWSEVFGSWSTSQPTIASTCPQVGGTLITGYCYLNGENLNNSFQVNSQGGHCPTGYILIGSTCTLNDARAVTPDGAIDYARAGQVISPASAADIDASSSFAIKPVLSGNAYSLQVVGASMLGNLISVHYDARADGGTDLISRKPVKDLQGNSGVQSKTYSFSPSGVVNSVSASTIAGTLSIQSGTAGSGSTATVVAAPAGSVFSGSSGSSFPSDYARSGEASAAAAALGIKLDGIGRSLSDTSSVNDPVSPDSSFIPGFGDTFSNLSGWSLPGHSSSCPQPSVDLSGILGSGSVYTLDAHCGLMVDHFAALRAAMIVVWSLSSLFIVLRA